MDYEIMVRNVSKKYNDQWVLKEVNQRFTSGSSYAFVGHNGCGKSTFLRILSGLTVPTSGSVSYSRKLKFAYIPDKLRPGKLTGRSYLKVLGEIEGISSRELNHKIETLAKDFFIYEMLEIPMCSLSKGTLQKILVVQALLGDMDVMLLDEPLSGQDQESQDVFVRKINELRMKGVTVFMSCHEEWLTQAISDKIFTFEEKRIVPYIPVKKQNYVLLLEKAYKDSILWSGMIQYGSGYQLIVKETDVKESIQKLWNSGWELKGMYYENSKNSKLPTETIF